MVTREMVTFRYKVENGYKLRLWLGLKLWVGFTIVKKYGTLNAPKRKQ